MRSAASEAPRASGTDWLDVEYDASGSMRAVTVSRGGDCLGGTCSQHYVYEWDEVGRLSRARRWDTDAAGADELANAAAVENSDADVYAGQADVELGYIYDGSDQRVVKTAIDINNNESHSVYIFSSLELRRAEYEVAQAGTTPDYELTELTEVAYLFANGVRLARVVFEPVASAVPSLDTAAADAKYGRGSKLHVFFELGDHLGSSSLVIDQQTSELVEATTYQAYGATESDYRPDRWANFREDYRFTGKEEDVEVGLQYFGKRYLNPLLGRWVSADPLAVHVPGEADLNLYAYVSGAVLSAVDPLGLHGLAASVFSRNDDASACAANPSCQGMNDAIMAPSNGVLGLAGMFRDAVAWADTGNLIFTPQERNAAIGRNSASNAAARGAFMDPIGTVKRWDQGLYARWNASEPDQRAYNRANMVTGGIMTAGSFAIGGAFGAASKTESVFGDFTLKLESGVVDVGTSPRARLGIRVDIEELNPRPVRHQDATNRWEEFLGPGPHSNIHPRTGAPDPDRLVSADGNRSIRYGRHEMESKPTKHHYHEETWTKDADGNVAVDNEVVRVPNPNP